MSLFSRLSSIFTKSRLDEETLGQLEELLIMADMGPRVAAELTESLRAQKFDKEISKEEVRTHLAHNISAMLQPCAKPLPSGGVILVVGVNGNGKTTTIGKLARHYSAQGKKVMLAAADTFRAAAVEQLQQWGARANIPVVSAAQGSDPAAVAYQAVERAKQENVDVLLIDTAGRLHNKSNLMDELKKIIKVMQKLDPSAPHAVLQVLDATTGQNALSQVQTFKEMVGVSGLIVTKLDGTAKGGVVVALARQCGLPIHAVGMGEAIDDLQQFNPEIFSENLLNR